MTQTILIVDDDKMTRRILQLLLMRNEYNVIEAENGQEALEIIEEKCPNLVVIDVVMPVMDGFDTVRRIRSKLNCSKLPVLFLTASADMESENEGIESGAQRFLTKPINLDGLVKTIKELIAESQMQSEIQ